MTNRSVVSRFTFITALVLGMGQTMPADAEVFPVTTSGRAKAYALTFPNPDHSWDLETWFGSTGDYTASAYQIDTTENISPGTFITCEVTSNSTAQIDASGASGSVMLRTDWVAINPFSIPNTQSAVFDSENIVTYSFITNTHGSITINIDSESNLPNIVPLDPQDVCNYAMAVNNTVYFNNVYTELLLNDQQTIVYEIFPGYHELKLERKPNSGIQPWPNCNVYSETNMTFTIETDPSIDTMGDMDCDTDVDMDDVPAMVMALLDPGLYQEFYGCIQNGDFTGDEWVDGADLQDFTLLLFGE